MRVNIKLLPVFLLLFALVFTSCKDENSVFDPDYEFPEGQRIKISPTYQNPLEARKLNNQVYRHQFQRLM